MNYQGLYGRRKRKNEELSELDDTLWSLQKKRNELSEECRDLYTKEYHLKAQIGGKIASRYPGLKRWLLGDHMGLVYEPGAISHPDIFKRNWIAKIIKRPIEWFIDYEATIFVLMAWKYSDLKVLGKDVVEKIICRLILR